MIRDPYTVLGVSRSSRREEIKRAFYKLAHLDHPDKGGDAEKFKEISRAYAEVKDHVPQPAYTPSGSDGSFTKDTTFYERGDAIRTGDAVGYDPIKKKFYKL